MSQNWFGTMIAAVSNDAPLGDAFMTGLIMMLVVFAALCVLSLTIWLFGRSGKDSDKASEKTEKPAPVPATAPKKAASVSIPAVSDEDDGAVAAAIAAAVAMLAPAGVTYRVKKITPVGRAARPAWAAAAIRQNTSPF